MSNKCNSILIKIKILDQIFLVFFKDKFWLVDTNFAVENHAKTSSTLLSYNANVIKQAIKDINNRNLSMKTVGKNKIFQSNVTIQNQKF